MTFRELDRSERIGLTDGKVKRVISQLKSYDLSPLRRFLGLENDLEFEDLGGTDFDFQGSDILLRSGNRAVYIQDKWRDSQRGSDLGIEFVRMYRTGSGIVIDGGRDLFQIPHGCPVIGKRTRDHWILAERDWENTKTKSDLILLHAKDSVVTYWIKSSVIKAISKGYFLKWISKFPQLEKNVAQMVFSEHNTKTYNRELVVTPGIDVKCLREPGDTKWVDVDDNSEECPIAKCIMYIPMDEPHLIEGRDYVVCRKGQIQ